MPVHKGQFDRDDPIIQDLVEFEVDQPGNGVDKIVDQIDPGYQFEVVAVEVFPKSTSSQIDYDVRIGGTSVLSSEITDPTAEQITQGTLVGSTGDADRRGSDTDTLDLVVDTDGTGNGTAIVRVRIRPWPAGGDPA